jgi:hypothetical protein
MSNIDGESERCDQRDRLAQSEGGLTAIKNCGESCSTDAVEQERCAPVNEGDQVPQGHDVIAQSWVGQTDDIVRGDLGIDC